MLIHGFSLVNARLLKAFGTAFNAIITHNVSLSVIFFRLHQRVQVGILRCTAIDHVYK